MSNYNQNLVFNGLGTLATSVPDAGPYFIEGHISLPTISQGGGQSSLVVVVNQNGSPIYTGQAGAEGFRTTMTAAANDAVTIVFSSAAAADQGLNVIKSCISIGAGQ